MPEKPAPTKPSQPAKKSGPGFFNRLLFFLLEIFLPGIVMGALLIYLFSAIGIWTLNRTIAMVLFAACLVVFSFVSSATLDSFTSKLQKGLSNTAALRLRLLKLVLGGLIVPASLFGSVNLILLPTGGTALDFLVQISQSPIKANQTNIIIDAIRGTNNREVRINGIQVLGSEKSTDAMQALLDLAKSNPNILKDAGQYQALVEALALYGKDAKPGLIELFNTTDPAGSTAPADSLYTRYFELAVEELKTESAGQAGGAEQILALEADVKARLAQLEQEKLQGTTGNLTHAFILDTFIQMNLNQDSDLLKIAKVTAANPAFPDGVRGRALLLVGKLGNKNDIVGLNVYLKGSSDYLRAHALQAMWMLQKKSPVSSQGSN